MRLFFTLLFLSISYIGSSQVAETPSIEKALNKFGFIQNQVFQENDTITYYLKNYKKKPQNLVVYIQGTDANPIFSYSAINDKVTFSRWFGDDFKKLDATYTFAIIPKPGMEGLYEDATIEVPQKYYKNNYLDYRVHQLDVAINHILENHIENPGKIVVYGHSEGAAIAAPLALKNKAITHLGFWAGNVLNNFYEFSLFNRIEALTGKISDKEAHQNIMGILNWYKQVTLAPDNTDLDHFGFTNKRWSSYEKAPIDYLVQLDIPVYALFGTEDGSTPIETAYLLPVKFIENRKENLTFEVCIGCNHSFQLENEDRQPSQRDKEFEKFMDWVKSSK